MMNHNLKSALYQGILIFLTASIGGILLAKPLRLEEAMPTVLLVGFILGSASAIKIYLYKKNTIEDERLISIRQKAQSTWFIVMIVLSILIPELAILYANYIDNPMIMLGTSAVALDELAWTFMTSISGVIAICLWGSRIMEKILMKRHEK